MWDRKGIEHVCFNQIYLYTTTQMLIIFFQISLQGHNILPLFKYLIMVKSQDFKSKIELFTECGQLSRWQI